MHSNRKLCFHQEIAGPLAPVLIKRLYSALFSLKMNLNEFKGSERYPAQVLANYALPELTLFEEFRSVLI